LTAQDIMAFSVEIYQRFRDELAERRFYSLENANASRYEEPFNTTLSDSQRRIPLKIVGEF